MQAWAILFFVLLTGLAHLLAHLMSAGSRHVPDGAFITSVCRRNSPASMQPGCRRWRASIWCRSG